MEEGTQEHEIHSKKVVRRLLGKNFLLVNRMQLTAFAKQTRGVEEVEEEMKQQQRMAVMRDLIKKIRSKERNGRQKPMVGLGVAGEGLESMDPHRTGRYHAEMVRMAGGAHEEETLFREYN